MRRIAIFSDIHGNLPALDAVLAQIASAGIAERYCLGDLVGYGPDPGGVIARIRDEAVPTIQGNYDEGVGTERGSCGCYYATEQARADGDASYAFTVAALDADEKAWLAALPSELRLAEESVRILLAHGSPRKINEYLLLDREEGQLARLAAAAGADVVCHGHIHIPYHRSFEVDAAGAGLPGQPGGADGPDGADGAGRTRIHYISSGSAGKPKDGDPRAAWVELVLGTEGEVTSLAPGDAAAGPAGDSGIWLGAVVHHVSYDVESVAAAMLAAGLPPTLAEALRRG